MKEVIMNYLVDSPVFGVTLTMLALEVGIYINRKTGLSVLNPLMLAILIIIGCLQVTGISYESYSSGGNLISFFLAPTTVVLAVPLYKKFHLLKANGLPIVLGIVAGSAINIGLIMFLANRFGLEQIMERSLIPKSITTPMGISLSNQLGGMPQVTVAAIMITGITGAIIGPLVFKLIKVEDEVAKGIAMGTSAHALGTVKAMEMGETEGAMSSLAIGLTGLFTVIIAPIFVRFFG